MPSSFDRIVRADRPLMTTLALIGVGFLVSLPAGLSSGCRPTNFRSAFGWTVAVGMIVTAVVITAVLAVATLRR